jgi:hypothetical protein
LPDAEIEYQAIVLARTIVKTRHLDRRGISHPAFREPQLNPWSCSH